MSTGWASSSRRRKEMSPMKDNVKPGEKWEFNEDVAACFANMLERSIPD